MVKLVLDGYTITGESVAGIGTAVVVKELGICFDLGTTSPEILACNTVLVSHAHVDHIGAFLTYLGIRSLLNRGQATLYLPDSIFHLIDTTLTHYQRLADSSFRYQLVKIEPFIETTLKKKLTVTALPLNHRIQTYGFLIQEQRVKLLEQYQHLTQNTIIQLKKESPGSLFSTVNFPVFAYIPDTDPDGLDALPSTVWQAKTLMIEATFLESANSLEKAQSGKHLRLIDIVNRLDRFLGDHIVLFHFSQIYKQDMIKTLVFKQVPVAWRNRIHCFCNTETQTVDN